jgi:exodeoxyribonuclease V gamma subunit
MLFVHRSERADGLALALRTLLAEPPDDAFDPEVVAVPTRGMERWLTQQLSTQLGASAGRGDGVCAGVLFPSPRTLIADAVATASGIDPDSDPWLPERIVWPLLEVVEACADEPWLRRLAVHLGYDSTPPDAVRQARRLSTLRQIAARFDRYARHRPDMIRAWAAGENPISAPWQAELWRRLATQIGVADPATRLEPACIRIRTEPSLLDLPARLALFGLTRLPVAYRSVLEALSTERDVHLFLLHPAPALWDKVGAAASGAAVMRRAADQTATLADNDLLASWGRDCRELQLVLGPPGEDRHHPVRLPSGTLLGALQQGVRDDLRAPGAPLPHDPDRRVALDPADRSIQIHACHGRARQVEVIRDAVLHALADSPTLEPRDVIVMCPDIETFAPLIQAAFGAGENAADGETTEAIPSEQRPVDLRVRLADRSLRQTNPLLGVVARLLELAEARLTASDVLGLADREPVRRRFRLDDDDLGRIQSWTSDSGIRWGLDGPHRAAFKLERLDAGTWRKGLDRVLLGVTMSEDDEPLFGGVLPLDDVDGSAIDLAGRLAELVERLGAAVDALSIAQPIEHWASAIGAGTDALAACAERDAWQRAELQRLLDDVVTEATTESGPASVSLTLAEVRALLAERLQGRPTRANFRTGHLTVCTLHPMRSVPHRVVCLLGLDDGAFPRQGRQDGDDLTLVDPRVGERDPRGEDRQLLLDALMAATERLIVTYTGSDERTNMPQPPAVPIGELLDMIDATARTDDGPAREQVVVRHPLQPFDPRNFDPGALAGDDAWSFDRVTLDGARALVSPRADPRPFLDEPLPATVADEPVELEELIRFVRHPVRAFLRRRLTISLGERSDELEDALRTELDGLQRWTVGQQMLDARLAGVERRRVCLAEIARGSLPPGTLGEPVLVEIDAIVSALYTASGQLTGGALAGGPLDVRLQLPGGRRLAGTVSGLRGEVLANTTYSRLAPVHRIVTWVRLLACVAADPERPVHAATIGRGDGDEPVAIARLDPAALGNTPAVRETAAVAALDTLVDLFERGMREPLPLYCKTSAAYAQARLDGVDALAAARKAWTSDWNYDGEDAQAEHRMVLGGRLGLDALLTQPPRPGEDAPGWPTEETTRFGRLARRMWDPLLTIEHRA